MNIETMKAVGEELGKRGIAVTLEYPGYISATKGFTTCGGMNFGTVNGFWGFDILDFDGEPSGNTPSFESVSCIHHDSEAIHDIADWIACKIANHRLLEAAWAVLPHVENVMVYSEGDHGDRIYIADVLCAAIAAVEAAEKGVE